MKTNLKKHFLTFGILAVCLIMPNPIMSAEKAKEKKSDSYTKLFKDKKPEKAVSEFGGLYKVDNKVYVELPIKNLDKEMMLTTTISSVSEATVLPVGIQTHDPLYVRFEKSSGNVIMKSINVMVVHDSSMPNQEQIINSNYRDPIIASFKIEGYNTDSTAVLIDFSKFVATPNSMMPIIPKMLGMYSLSSTPKSELNSVRSIKAFKSNLSVKTDFSYTISASIMQLIPVFSNLPFTIGTTISLSALPESAMRPRIADSRIGIGSSRRMNLPSGNDGIKPIFYAHRWNLVPADVEAYKQGAGSVPVKPIIFYLDPTFPDSWKRPIREGVLRWNRAFEKIGFKQALQIKDFPANDSLFDADNVEYNCIRYVPAVSEAINSSFKVNPATGEILNAGITIYNNIPEIIRQRRFILTANVDQRVRNLQLPQELFEESLSHLVAREVGLTLGLLPNHAASASIPTASLRSAEFTRKHGITPSIMDDVYYNYVAQPEDKNVVLTTPELGVYDYYAIDWNYRYFGNDVSQDKQNKTLEALVDEKIESPMYRYTPDNKYNPQVLSEDLGDDPMLAGTLGAKNLKNISMNLDKWITNDDDSRIKDRYNLLVAQQLHKYLKNVLPLIGGVYLNPTKENSNIPRYKVVPKDKQRAAVRWSIDFIKNFTMFANRKLEKKGQVAVSYYDQLIEYIVGDFFKQGNQIVLSSFIDKNSYTQSAYYDDVFNALFANASSGRPVSDTERFMQRYFVNMAVAGISSGGSKRLGASSLTGLSGQLSQLMDKTSGRLSPVIIDLLKDQPTAFGDPTSSILPSMNLTSFDDSKMYFFQMLNRLKPVLQQASRNAANQATKAHYTLLEFAVRKALEK